jgi:hypothetical protein
MRSRLVLLLALAITAAAALAAEYNYTLVLEITEHSYIRETASTSGEVASEIAAGARVAADPIEIETPDDPSCKKWFAVEYRLSGDITVHGFLCTRLARVVP